MQRRKTRETVQSKLIHEKQQLTRPIQFFKFRFAATYMIRRTVVQLCINLHSIVLITFTSSTGILLLCYIRVNGPSTLTTRF